MSHAEKYWFSVLKAKPGDVYAMKHLLHLSQPDANKGGSKGVADRFWGKHWYLLLLIAIGLASVGAAVIWKRKFPSHNSSSDLFSERHNRREWATGTAEDAFTSWPDEADLNYEIDSLLSAPDDHPGH